MKNKFKQFSGFVVFTILVITNAQAQESSTYKSNRLQLDSFIDFDEQCFSNQEDYAIYVASEAEEKALNTFFPISSDLEKQTGKTIHTSFDYEYIEDERTEKLSKMLEDMKKHVSRSDIDYTVFLIKDDKINAWTTPGGYIYVTTAIIDFTESDDEIANILGHEIGHNEHKHTQKLIQRRAPLTMLFGNQAKVIVNIWSKLVVSFNHHQELESDRIGLELSRKIGYDPKKGLAFWLRMAKDEKQNRINKLFRTHPYSKARYDCGIDYLK